VGGKMHAARGSRMRLDDSVAVAVVLFNVKGTIQERSHHDVQLFSESNT
jgi:hypothetical protein